MDMFAIHLGKVGADGFKAIEMQRGLASSKDEMEERARELLRTRGPQVGANRVRLVVGRDSVVWEFP